MQPSATVDPNHDTDTGPGPAPRARRAALVLTVATLVGIAAFLGPFVLSVPQIAGADRGAAHAGDAPLVFAALGILCLIALLVETGGRDPDAKQVALLGVLVATNAALRLVPDLLGASPIYFLPIMVGYVWGPSFGFLLGAASLALSALLTGGIGPWVPFQMLTLGWVGMTAGLLPWRTRHRTTSIGHRGKQVPTGPRARPWADAPLTPRYAIAILLLAVFAGLWGFLFGAIMNLWFWPFAAPAAPVDAGLYWAPGLGLAETVRRYAVFYLATSATYDATRAVGNVTMMAVFGRSVLLLLLRFRQRFTWEPVIIIGNGGERETPDRG